MAKTFYVSPGRSYTVTASEGTTITYPGITKPAATIGASGSVTFNCTGTEIVVSDNNAQIVQNFNNAGAAVAGAGEGGSVSSDDYALLEGDNTFTGTQAITGDVTITGTLTVTDGDSTTSTTSLDTPEGVFNILTYTNETGTTTLYIAAEGSQTATEKYNGKAFLGFTVVSPDGTVLSEGTKSLEALLTDNN